MPRREQRKATCPSLNIKVGISLSCRVCRRLLQLIPGCPQNVSGGGCVRAWTVRDKGRGGGGSVPGPVVPTLPSHPFFSPCAVLRSFFGCRRFRASGVQENQKSHPPSPLGRSVSLSRHPPPTPIPRQSPGNRPTPQNAGHDTAQSPNKRQNLRTQEPRHKTLRRRQHPAELVCAPQNPL